MSTRTAIAGFGIVLMLLSGCVSQRKSTEQLLTWSGFKKVPAATPARQELLESLPKDTISKVNRNGKPYFVYPDRKRKLFYIGNQAEYESFQSFAGDERAMLATRSGAEVETHAEMISVLDWVQ